MLVAQNNTFLMQIFLGAVLKNWHDRSFQEGAMLREKKQLDFLEAVKRWSQGIHIY